MGVLNTDSKCVSYRSEWRELHKHGHTIHSGHNTSQDGDGQGNHILEIGEGPIYQAFRAYPVYILKKNL